MERKKRSHIQQFGKFYFPKPANEMKRPAKRTKSPVKRTKIPAKHEETTMRGQCPARIYAHNRPRFANLSKMSNPDTKLLEKYFAYFTKNLRMSNSWRCSTLCWRLFSICRIIISSCRARVMGLVRPLLLPRAPNHR
jgi:hypothetical protein